jgi:GDSL-like lipase/acylhydrolase family protein
VAVVREEETDWHDCSVADPLAFSRWLSGMSAGFATLILFAVLTAAGTTLGWPEWGRWLTTWLGLPVSVWWVANVMKRFRVVALTHGRSARLKLVLAVAMSATALLVAWWRYNDPAPEHGGAFTRKVVETFGLGFLGVLLAFLAASFLVAEFRESNWLGRYRGVLLLGLCLALTLLALSPLLDGAPKWALLPAVAGFVAGQAAVVTGAQTLLGRSPRMRPRRFSLPTRLSWLTVGSGLFLGSAGLFNLWTSLAWTLWVAGPVLILLLLTTSRGEWDSILLVALFAIVFTLGPDVVRPGPELRPADDATVFAVFGDSYISGEGADAFYEGTNQKGVNECRRAPGAWAPVLAREGAPSLPSNLVFLACSGARAREIWQVDQAAQGPAASAWQEVGQGQLAQFRYENPTLVDSVAFSFVSLGGNDSGFSEIGRSCMGPGDCTDIAQTWLDALDQPRDFGVGPATTLRDELVAAYVAIKNATGAPVIAVPYPLPVTDAGCDSTLLSESEHRFINEFVTELNRVVKDAAALAGAHYIGAVESALEGRRVCDPGASGLNFIEISPVPGSIEDTLLPVNWIHNSVHPNGIGHALIAEVVRDWLSDNDSTVDPPPVADTGPLVARDIDELAIPGARPCRDNDSRENCERADESAAWALGELRLLGRDLYIPVAMLFSGAALISLFCVERAERRSRDVARRRGGTVGYAPSWIERTIFDLLHRFGLRWAVDRLDPRRGTTSIRSDGS